MWMMTHPVRRFVNILPDSLVSKARKTPLETLYYDVVSSSAGIQEVKVETAIGEFNLIVPEGATLPGGVSYEEGVHEPVMVDILDSILNSDTVFYDVGARYGYFVGVAQEIGVKPSNIHAFEQHRLSFNLLSKGWGNTKTHVQEATVGEAEESLSIDDYVKEHQQPDVIKIDVEGEEVSVLRGALNTIVQQAPQLLIEVHPRRLNDKGHSTTELVSLLDNQGYVMKCTNHREEVSEVDWYDVSKFDESNSTYLLHAEH